MGMLQIWRRAKCCYCTWHI